MTQGNDKPKKPRIPPSDKNAHESKRYRVEGMPTQRAIEKALARLVQSGLRKRAIVETAPILIDLQQVRFEARADMRKPDLAVATREYLGDAIARMESRRQRILLEILLGVGDSRWDNRDWRREPAKVRRREAGRYFRTGERQVTGGTIRQHYEPDAIRALAEILIADELGARQEARDN